MSTLRLGARGASAVNMTTKLGCARRIAAASAHVRCGAGNSPSQEHAPRLPAIDSRSDDPGSDSYGADPAG